MDEDSTYRARDVKSVRYAGDRCQFRNNRTSYFLNFALAICTCHYYAKHLSKVALHGAVVLPQCAQHAEWEECLQRLVWRWPASILKKLILNFLAKDRISVFSEFYLPICTHHTTVFHRQPSISSNHLVPKLSRPESKTRSVAERLTLFNASASYPDNNVQKQVKRFYN